MKNTILMFCCLLVCSVSVAQEKTVNKSFTNIKSIRLNTASGDIVLKKGSGNDIKVLVKYTYSDEDYKVLMEQNGTRLTLKEEFGRGNHSGNSTWTLEVPDNIDLNVNTGSGDLTADQLAMELRSNSGSGNVMLTAVKGEIDINTGSGDYELDKVEGEVTLNTGSGDVRASNGTGNYSFNTGSGNIKVDQLKGDFNLNTGSGNVRAENLTITASSSFNTGSGNANVVLSGPLDHNISVNSGSGDAKLNFGGNAISGEVIMTANKSGGEIVAPFKFDKEETIEDDNGRNARIRKTAKLGNKNIQIKVGTGSGTAEIVK
jgi:DUF4097 and DUF4098 domain-containing protein YvlB